MISIFENVTLEYRIFGKTLSLILDNLENYLLNSYDAIGLLLMIKVRILLNVRRIRDTSTI